jgi:hypothetical protein
VEAMGMYNELNNISRAVSGQATQKKKDAEYKNNLADLKIQLKDLLQLELFEGLKNNENIFDIDYKLHVISKTLGGFKNTLKYVDIFNKYENDVKIYLLSSYYNIANQARIIHQRTNKETAQNQQLKNDILEIKKQQETERLKKLQQQNVQRQQVQQPQKSSGGMQILGIILTIICFPIGLLILSILAAASKQK